MTTYYADSSALVKRYVTEMGSAWVKTLCDPAAGHVIAHPTGLPELGQPAIDQPQHRTTAVIAG